jgi:hypothetical protein
MPYVSQEDRDQIAMPLENLLDRLKAVPDDKLDGVLNYVVSRLVAGSFGKAGWRYRLIARAVAVFKAAGDEFYRRVAGPYEDKAIAKNGDIPEYTQ